MEVSFEPQIGIKLSITEALFYFICNLFNVDDIQS